MVHQKILKTVVMIKYNKNQCEARRHLIPLILEEPVFQHDTAIAFKVKRTFFFFPQLG